MNEFKKALIIRHRRENLKKCSLRGLEQRKDFIFLTYPTLTLPPLDRYILLTFDAPLLSAEDRDLGLIVLDGTWRLAKTMEKTLNLSSHPLQRSLPATYQTAYPRRQQDCPEPQRGLSSCEALWVAFSILGWQTEGLLDHYYWKEDFLIKNGVC